MSTGLLVFLGLSRCQLGVTALGLGPVWFCIDGVFQQKTRKIPSALDSRALCEKQDDEWGAAKTQIVNGVAFVLYSDRLYTPRSQTGPYGATPARHQVY